MFKKKLTESVSAELEIDYGKQGIWPKAGMLVRREKQRAPCFTIPWLKMVPLWRGLLPDVGSNIEVNITYTFLREQGIKNIALKIPSELYAFHETRIGYSSLEQG